MEVLVGDDDQLSDNVTSYNVNVDYGNTYYKEEWLKSTLKQSVKNVGELYILPIREIYSDNSENTRGLRTTFDKSNFINKKG